MKRVQSILQIKNDCGIEEAGMCCVPSSVDHLRRRRWGDKFQLGGNREVTGTEGPAGLM